MRVPVLLTEGEKRQVDFLAKAQGKSMNATIVQAVEEHLERLKEAASA